MEIQLINGHNTCVFSEEEKKFICEMYIDKNYSMLNISKMFGLNSSKPIYRVLDEMDIDHSRGNLSAYRYNYPDMLYDAEIEADIKNRIKEIIPKKQKYKINEYYFDDIRNPEVVYTIGFLYADGCNNNNQSISLTLEEQDGYILEKMNINMQNEKPISFIDYSNKNDFGYSYENQYSLTIFSKRIVQVLSILGVVPRKSLILEFPRWLHPSLYPAFIKGVYDGDGSLYRYVNTKTGKSNTVCTITSTENFCKAIMDISAKYIGINSHFYDASCHNGITRVFSICGYNICKKFLDWIYSIDTICLQRKYERYCDYYGLDKTGIV